METALRSYPVPTNDTSRADVLAAMQIERRRSDPFFVHVTEAAKAIFDAPIAYTSLMSRDTQVLLHCNGADVDATPRDASLCAFTVAAKETIILHDTWLDARSAAHPAVVDNARLRFSASAPVILSSGFCIGTLCVVDVVPHDAPDAAKIALLEHLAAMVSRFYEAPFEPDADRADEIRRIGREAQDEFLALIGHELRTPLNGICGLTPLLELANDESVEIQTAISDSADLLHRVVDSILIYTELSSGAIDMNDTDVDLGAILRKAVSAHRALMKLGGKTCDASAVPASLPLLGDPEKLELAFSCVLSNVVVHGGDRSRIEVSRTSGRDVEIAIFDDGPGISPARENRIWQPFGTGEAVRTRRADGIGLGLPLARRLLELHGGDIILDQSGSGFSVRIRMPAWRCPDAS